jgi:hypothetical protein
VRRLDSPFEGNVDVGYCISGSEFRCMSGHFGSVLPAPFLLLPLCMEGADAWALGLVVERRARRHGRENKRGAL